MPEDVKDTKPEDSGAEGKTLLTGDESLQGGDGTKDEKGDLGGKSAGEGDGKPNDEKKPQDEKKPEDKKPPEEKKVPEKYELKLPEKTFLTQEDLGKIALIAKERGLSQEEAQGLVEERNQVVADYQSSQVAALKARSEEWVTQVEADKEIGGAEFEKNVALANRVITRYASPDFVNTLKTTGLGNHPELVRVFVKIGKAMSEDQLVSGGKPANQKPERIEDRWYKKTAS